MANQRTKTALSIDRASREPAYAQLANSLRQAIARGEYRAGDQLPTEAKLRAALKLSKMTVRRAITLLIDQGVVRGTRGHGTYVQPLRLASASFDLSVLHALLTDEGVTAKVLSARIIPAGPYAAATPGDGRGRPCGIGPAAAATRRGAPDPPPRVTRLRADAAYHRGRAGR